MRIFFLLLLAAQHPREHWLLLQRAEGKENSVLCITRSSLFNLFLYTKDKFLFKTNYITSTSKSKKLYCIQTYT